MYTTNNKTIYNPSESTNIICFHALKQRAYQTPQCRQFFRNIPSRYPGILVCSRLF